MGNTSRCKLGLWGQAVQRRLVTWGVKECAICRCVVCTNDKKGFVVLAKCAVGSCALPLLPGCAVELRPWLVCTVAMLKVVFNLGSGECHGAGCGDLFILPVLCCWLPAQRLGSDKYCPLQSGHAECTAQKLR